VINVLIAILVSAISFVMLLQFLALYCHSLIADSRDCELSEQTREISGVTAKMVCGDQFRRLLQLIALCPEPGGDSFQIRAVSAYFSMLGLVRALFSRTFPPAAQWIETERGGCAYVAAVVLDRRIAYNRMLKAQQTESQF
jgi:hypothetical protein